MTLNQVNRCLRFRSLLQQKKGALALFGAHDGMTARTVAQEGFPGLYLSGGAISASFGVPDVGILTMDHFSSKIKEISLSSGLPILADADTGFGEEEMVRRVVYEYFLAGACGLHLEDQVFPKRCGHLDGKSLVPVSDMVSKIKTAKQASNDVSDGSFIVCARTDARAVEGVSSAIDRALHYVEDGGADMIFPEGLETVEEFETFASEIRKTEESVMLLANMTEFGKTKYIPLDRFSSLGYNAVIYPVSTLRVQMKATEEFLRQFKKDGGMVEPQLHKMRTREDLYKALKYEPGKPYQYPSSIVEDDI